MSHLVLLFGKEEVLIKPVSKYLLNGDHLHTWRMEYPDGEVNEFEARSSDIGFSVNPSGGITAHRPLVISGEIRRGSIFDPEGAD